MVLEEVKRSSPTTYQDDASPSSAFSSTGDSPYPTNNNETPATSPSSIQYTVDMSQLPSGLPILGPLFGYGEQRRAATINHSLLAVTRLVRRQLRPEEVQAVSYHTAKGLSIASYGFPVGALGGAWRWYNTLSTFRFPFWGPNQEKFNPNKLGPLQGEVARRGWHLLRGCAYGVIGGWIGRTIFAGYAATVAATGQRMDGRMKDIVDTLNKMSREQRVQRGQQSVRQGPQQQQPQQQMQQEGAVDQSYGGYTRTSSGDISYDSGNASTDTGVMSDRAATSRDQRQQAPQGTYGAQNTSQTYSMDKVASQPSIFDFDDASPTAQSQYPSSQSGGGNVWEQLRRGGSGPPRPSDRQSPSQQSQNAGGSAWTNRRGEVEAEQRGGSTLGDSFGFSSGSEEDRRRERERAQREFDERVERERRGEDFEGSNRRW